MTAVSTNALTDRTAYNGEMDLSRDDRLRGALHKALSHELPNRMLAIQGLTRLLELDEGERLSPEGKEYVQRLAAAAQRTHLLVKALAEFVRTGRAGELPETVAVPSLLREAVAEVKQLCPGARFEYHFPQTDPCIRVARSALRQVALHLLRNASQAAEPERNPSITVGAREAGSAVEFWVSDNGCGLTPEDRGRLFEPFFRRFGTDGVGLGLFLVRHIVEGWNGSVRVESVPGEGSTFTVTVPSAVSHASGETL
jgi:signal transduction histidine kinase